MRAQGPMRARISKMLCITRQSIRRRRPDSRAPALAIGALRGRPRDVVLAFAQGVEVEGCPWVVAAMDDRGICVNRGGMRARRRCRVGGLIRRRRAAGFRVRRSERLRGRAAS